MSSSVESSHYFVSQLFIDTIWLIVTDKISEGKIRYGCFFFFFQFPWKKGTVTQKDYGGNVDEGVVNSLLLAPSRTHMIWCCFGHKLKVYELEKLFIILFDTSFDYLNPLCHTWNKIHMKYLWVGNISDWLGFKSTDTLSCV